MDFNFEAKQLIIGAAVLVILVLAIGAYLVGKQITKISNANSQKSPLAQSSPRPFTTPTPSPISSTTPADTTVIPLPTPTPSPKIAGKSKSSTTSFTTTTTVVAPTPASFNVIQITANSSPATYSGTCSKDVTFYGTITTNGKGSVTYKWIRSDGSDSSDKTLSFDFASSKNVDSDTRGFGGSASGWDALRVTSPNSKDSNQANFSVSCT